jgi:ATP-dependent helicase HrpA
MYPVEVRYFFPDDDDAEGRTTSPVELAARRRWLVRESARGDILVFMPTEQDIRETCELLGDAISRKTRILPLLRPAQRRGAASGVRRHRGRKIIVATNVAETSITIPGIRYVVDTGWRAFPSIPRSRTTALPVVPISRSSADQRRDAAGGWKTGSASVSTPRRTTQPAPVHPAGDPALQPGRGHPAHDCLKLGDIADFPFIDRPAEKAFATDSTCWSSWKPSSRHGPFARQGSRHTG